MNANTNIKKELRKRILAARIAIEPDAAEYASNAISNTLITEYVNRVICSYVSFRGEVDLTLFHEHALATGKTLLLPYVGDTMYFCEVKSLNDLVKSKMGILEPNPGTCRIWTYKEIWEKDPLVLTPGVAFTLHGQRMGYGGGYYDRFFQTRAHDKRGTSIGICFDVQIVSDLPTEEHDIPVDRVLVGKTR